MNVVAQRLAAAVLCALALGGCAAIGFEPLDEQVNPLPQAGADAMSGGTSGTFTTGGQGGNGGNGGQSGSGGQSGQGGGGTGGRSGSGGSGGSAGDGGQGGGGTGGDSGSGGTGGSSADPCEGKPLGSPCDDGNFCTIERCGIFGCEIELRSCSDECNTGTCDEDLDLCLYTPRPNDTECGDSDPPVMCEDGKCPKPAEMCTIECNPECSSGECNYDCTNVNSCRPSCVNGADCAVDCTGTIECQLRCQDATCSMQCEESGTCDVDCSGRDASCSIVCTDPSGCEDNECLDGASCALRCLEQAEDCGFKECWAGEQQCDDGLTITCNADCEDESRWSGWSGRW